MLNVTLASCKAAHERFISGLPDARNIQLGILRRVIESNCESSFGREHDFQHVSNVESLRSRVPIRAFDDFRPYIQRILAGEPQVLSSGPLFKFISSSGSTGAAKVIPLTRSYFTESFNPFFGAYVYGVARTVPNFLSHSPNTLNFKWDPLHAKPKLANGEDHLGLSQLHLSSEFEDRGLLEPGTDAPWSQVPKTVACEIERIYYRLRIACAHSVHQVVGINPAIIAAVPHILDEFAERLADEVERGTLLGEPFAPPAPKRAAELRAMRREHGELLPKHVWPDIRAIVCWDEGISSLYLENVAEQFGERTQILPAPLGASECPVALPLLSEASEGAPPALAETNPSRLRSVPRVLAYNSAFFEFLDVATGSSTPLLFDELRVGGHYAVVVTQQAGFCRYLLGDVVEVTGHFGGVPTLAYAGRFSKDVRTQDCGLLQAVRAWRRQHGLDITNFCFLRDDDALELQVEFARPPQYVESSVLEQTLRLRLSEASMGTLVRLKALPKGHFYDEWKTRVRAGVRPAQVKDRISRIEPGGGASW